MTVAAPTSPSAMQDSGAADPPRDAHGIAPESWADLRAQSDIQFAPVTITRIPEDAPTWFERALAAVREVLAGILQPVAEFIAQFWWILAIALAALVLFALARVYGPLATRARSAPRRIAPGATPDWRPDEGESLALLEDADRLAAEGRYDEATHLLLKRSVGQIAAARPGWVEPSSTARELAALPDLPDAARTAFGTLAERVECSLFALRSLDRTDWDAARAAYAEFALHRIGA